MQRFSRELTSLPEPALIGRLYEKDPERGRMAAAAMGRVTARELRGCGITMNYAPVLDRDLGISRVIGDRSWGREADQVIDLAGAYIEGLHQGGVTAVGKHFPGHGGVAADTHRQLPIDERPEREIREDMRPFAALASRLACLMTAHIVYASMDPSPATLSSFWLRDLLGAQLGYQGLILSDDLRMGAIREKCATLEEALERAFCGGCDLMMLCHDRASVKKALDFAQKEGWPPLTEAQVRRLRPPAPSDDADEQEDGDLLASLL